MFRLLPSRSNVQSIRWKTRAHDRLAFKIWLLGYRSYWRIASLPNRERNMENRWTWRILEWKRSISLWCRTHLRCSFRVCPSASNSWGLLIHVLFVARMESKHGRVSLINGIRRNWVKIVFKQSLHKICYRCLLRISLGILVHTKK